MKKFYFLLSFLLVFSQLFSQRYLELMEGDRVNFIEVQNEAEKYFLNKDQGQGSGYKQYKRWEYIHKREIDDAGFIINANQVWDEKNKFMQTWENQQTQYKNGNQNRSLSGNWTSLGPWDWNRTSGWNPGVGRIVAIDVDDNNQNLIYVGSPSGGLWKTTDGGANWTVLTDNMPIMDIWSVEIDPTNPNIVYMGTSGGGVLKTIDGGATWNQTGSMSGIVRTILVNPNNNQIVFAARSGAIFRSTNGGTSWTQVSSESAEDIMFKPGNTNIVYACGGSFQRSTNGGVSWTTISSGIVSTQRMKMAVTPANPNYIYIVQASGSIFGQVYRSTDSGLNFTVRAQYNGTNNNYLGYDTDGTGTTGQATRDMAITVSSTNANEVIIAGIILFKSTDGGANYTALTTWSLPSALGYVHADVEVLKTVGSNIYTGSDGGIYKSSDAGASFTDLTTGLGIRQFYRIGCSQSDPNVVSGGSQDNGTSVMRGVNRDWVDWLGADGMESFVDYSNANNLYGTSQYGSMYKSTNQGNSRSSISKPAGVGNGDWVTPFEIDPQVPTTIYVGFDQVYKNTNSGIGGWTAIGGGLGSNLNEICLAPSNSNYIYVASGAQMSMTSNGGATWTALNEPWSGGPPWVGGVNYISVDPNDPLRVAVAVAATQNIYITNDGGVTWVDKTLNLPNIGANCILLDGSSGNGIYVGMQTGIYFTDDFLGSWIPFFTDLPNVRVNELEIVSSVGKIRAATYGRGLWESDVYSGNSANLPPTANFSALPTNPSIGQSVQFSDLSSGAPNAWSWSFPGGNPSSSAVQNPSVTYAAPGSYNVSLMATNVNGSDTVLKQNYITVNPYCIPDPSSGTSFNDFIDGVTIGTINNLSTGSSTGPNYTDYTSLSTDLALGTSQSLTIVGGNYSPDYYAAWIDYNNDFDFDDPGEKLGEVLSNAVYQTLNINFNIPSGIALGSKVMRVRCVYNNSNLDPCTDYTYGETEDYTVNIVQSAACIPTYSSGTSDGDFIDGISLGTLSNLNTGSQNGPDYTNYSALSCDVEKGINHDITIVSGSYFTDVYAVWVDWNKNGSFLDPGEKISEVTSNIASEPLTIPFPLDITQDTGYYNMRVRCAWNANGMNPCINYGWGETEDYRIHIVPSSDLCLAPQAPLALNDSVCVSGSMTVGVNGTGNFFNWYSTVNSPNYFHRGANYTSPVLTTTQNYYVAASAEDTSLSLTTFFASNNGANGNLFNISSLKNIRIDGFDINLNTTASQEILVYYKQGTYEGFETQAGVWTLLGVDTVIGQGMNNPTFVNVGGLEINQEETYGILIYTPQGNFRYTNLPQDSIISNNDIYMKVGKGMGTLFGTIFAPRAFNGTVHYSKYPGCESPRTIVSAKVNPLPQVQISSTSNLCESDGAISLNAAPIGGTFSGTGVSGNQFDPQIAGIGVHEITYSYTDNSGCSNSDTLQITIRANPSVSLNLSNSICENASSLTLSGNSPLGGTFSGPGVSGNSFSPLTAGIGFHTISYNYTDSFACSNSASDIIEVLAKPTVIYNANQSFCEGASSITLSGGNPSGGIYTGTGVSSGIFNPISAGLGMHNVTYSYQAANGCSASDISTMTVNANPSVSHSALSNVCIDAGAISLTGGSPSGGTYSGTGVSGNSFDPQIAGVGTHSITYTFTDGNNCSSVSNVSITVNPLPNVSLSPIASICENESPITLNGASPSGGMFSGLGVSAGQFNPSVAGVGTHVITYTFTNANGCSNSNSRNIQVLPKPSVTFIANQSFCEGSSAIVLSGGSPAGGVYSGIGVSSGQFNPSIAGIGAHVITYAFQAPNGCSASDISTMTVNANPSVTHSALSDVCTDAGAITLTGGSPSGGTYSGTGVSGNSFDPQIAGVGTHSITYTFTNGNNCSSVSNVSITVNPLPNVSLSPIASICENESPTTLNGASPSGGTFSGLGVSAGQFNPSVAGVGTHVITYTFTNANGCSNSKSRNIQVLPKPTVTFNADQSFCEGASSVLLSGGSPTGGIYSGPGVNAALFNPIFAGLGNHEIIYNFQDVNGCSSADTSIFTVNPKPIVSHSSVSDLCFNDSPINLTGGNPGGGTYSGLGVNGSTFDPSTAGVGNHIIYYSYSDANSCQDSTQISITVYALPNVILNSFPDICENESAISLNGGSPLGGTYSGAGVNGNMFSPQVSGSGAHLISYSYTDINSCSNSASQNIDVLSAPQASLILNQSLCENEGPINLTGGLPSGGFYFGTGVSSNTFDPSISGIGIHNISYIYLDVNTCSDTASDIITINAVPQVSHSSVPDFCLVDSNYQLTGGTPIGGVYSGLGINGNSFNPSLTGIGLYPITYSFTDSNSCMDSVTFGVQVNSNPSVFFTALNDVCENGGVQNINIGVPAGGVYSGPGVTGTNFDPSISGSGTFELFYSFTNINGCTGIDTSEITVFALPAVTVGPFASVCENQNSIALSTGLPIGGIYSGTAVSNGNFNPSISGVGLFPIMYSYTDTNSCSNQAIDNIEVKIAPIADFGYVAQSLIVSFSDSSSGGQSWSWDFGDGSTSNLQNPVYTFDSAAVYQVCLTTSENGCSDSYCEFITIISTSLNASIKTEDIRFYPNPFGSELNYEILTDRTGKVKMDLIDMRGTIIETYNVELESGMNKGLLKIQNIASGTYIIRISDNSFYNTVKVEKGN